MVRNNLVERITRAVPETTRARDLWDSGEYTELSVHGNRVKSGKGWSGEIAHP